MKALKIQNLFSGIQSGCGCTGRQAAERVADATVNHDDHSLP